MQVRSASLFQLVNVMIKFFILLYYILETSILFIFQGKNLNFSSENLQVLTVWVSS
jgi:hypothetical protein